MKKNWKKKAILAAVIILLVAVLAIIAVLFLRRRSVQTMLQQQNYVASKLLEMGDYEEGRQLAAASEQSSPNVVSEQLLALAAAFQEEYDYAVLYIEAFDGEGENELLSAIRKTVEDYQQEVEDITKASDGLYSETLTELENNLNSDLIILLLQVQESISVKKDSASVKSMISLLSSDGGSVDDGELDNSLLSSKVKAISALKSGDYSEAMDAAQTLLSGDSSFENRALVANIAAAAGTYDSELVELNGELQSLQEKKTILQSELSELQSEYNQETNENKKQKLQAQIEAKQEQIEEKENEIRTTPIKQAINYIEATTPITQRNTISYKIVLAQLYYQADNESRAQELLLDTVQGENDSSEMVALLLDHLLDNYQEDGESFETQLAWERIADLLNLIETIRYNTGYDQESFYSFLINLLDQKFHGLIIRSIDSTAFPTVRVTVNMAMELDERLTQRDFELTDMGESVSDFRLLDEEELETEENLSVMLVVDHSGSMDGNAMTDTKEAVASFIRDMADVTDMGLAIFDSFAEIVSPLGSSKNELLSGISSVEPNGGTSIYLGLQVAGDELTGVSGRKVIILLSDGYDGDSSRIDEVLETLNDQDIYVYTIGFGGVDTEYLSYIATSCGGKFLEADSSALLTEIYASIGKYIQNDYVLEFTAETDLENFSRTLRVDADVYDAYAEKDYNVGVALEDILSEEDRTPLANYFQEIGGSYMGTDAEINEE